MVGDDAKVEKHLQTIKGKLEGYERLLSKQKYLGGDVSDSFPLVTYMPKASRSISP